MDSSLELLPTIIGRDLSISFHQRHKQRKTPQRKTLRYATALKSAFLLLCLREKGAQQSETELQLANRKDDFLPLMFTSETTLSPAEIEIKEE
jgi:hypothetical protein